MSSASDDRTRHPDWLHLADDEEIVWQRRPHPVALGVRFVLGVLVVAVGLAIARWGYLADLRVAGYPVVVWFGALLALVGALLTVYRVGVWANTRYVITTAELYEKRGIVSRNVTQFRLDRIQNTRLNQSMPGRALGYADLTVYTAGSGEPELTFSFVPDPGEASGALAEQFEAATGRDAEGL